MGIKKKKLRDRAQSDYIRFMKHAETSVNMASDALASEFKLQQRLIETRNEMNRMREEFAESERFFSQGAPVILNARSFREKIGNMPRIPPGERPHMRSFTIEVDRAPAHIPHRIGFSEPSRYVREKLVFDIAEVIVPGMRGRSQFGYRIPSGIVLVEMD